MKTQKGNKTIDKEESEERRNQVCQIKSLYYLQFFKKSHVFGIEELNTGHLLRAAPASSQSRIFKDGVTNTLNPAFG